MRKTATKMVLAAVLAIFFAGIAAQLPAAAAQIGVADYKAILENSYAYGEMLDRLNKEMELAKINLGKQLMTERDAIRRRQLTVQFEDEYSRRRNALVRPLFEEVKATVVQVAQQYGLSKVEDAATGARGTDITRAVIAALNSKHPKSAGNYGYGAPAAQPAAASQPAPQYAQQQYAQPAPQYGQQQYAQPAAANDPFAVAAPAADPFAEPDTLTKQERKARKAQAKAEKAARKAEALAAKAKEAQEEANQLAAQAGTMPVSAAAQQPAFAQANQGNTPNTFAQAATPAPMYTEPSASQYSARRTRQGQQSARRSFKSLRTVPTIDAPASAQPEYTEEPARQTARKTAAAKTTRPKRTVQTADIYARTEPDSAAEAAGKQRRATNAVRNVKTAPAEYRSSAKSNLEVQFGADYDKPDITRMVNLAKKNGISNAYVLETTSQKTGKLFWRARVPAANKAEAQALSRKLSSIGLSNYITDAR